jgi:DNA-binding MarR family transcriptional regulator
MAAVASQDPGAENSHHLIGILLLTAQRHMAQRVVEELHLRGYEDLREAHQTIFALLPAAGESLTDLAARVGITKQSAASLVDYLEQGGYLRRRMGPNDRRLRVIERTERGWQVNAVSMAAIAFVQEEWAQLIGEQDMQVVVRCLRTIGHSLGLNYSGSVSQETERRVPETGPWAEDHMAELRAGAAASTRRPR